MGCKTWSVDMMDWCRQNKITVILLVLGVVFLCIGAAQGGYQDAFRKAVRVCLECIGIG